MVVVTIYSYPCKGMNKQVFFDFSFLWYGKKSVYLTHLKSGCILFYAVACKCLSKSSEEVA